MKREKEGREVWTIADTRRLVVKNVPRADGSEPFGELYVDVQGTKPRTNRIG